MHPALGLFSATFFHFRCFMLVISLFKMALQHTAEMLSGIPKHRKAEMCLTEKSRVPH